MNNVDKMERTETARQAIKCSRQTPLSQRSASAIDRSPQIERTVYKHSYLLTYKNYHNVCFQILFFDETMHICVSTADASLPGKDKDAIPRFPPHYTHHHFLNISISINNTE